jgi:2-polyprenyl-3-methyl-5-hydroxy-6-metoxy-1,4-benzoquinol methylase
LKKLEKSLVRLEQIACPYCNSNNNFTWSVELGFKVVRCVDCLLLFVNPRPTNEHIDTAVRTGTHSYLNLDVRSRRIARKIKRYKKIINDMFRDLWRTGKPISWIDVGCGYGEIIEAVQQLATSGSRIVGLEPMHDKAQKARQRGLNVIEGYLQPEIERAQVISIIDIFSHIPNFHMFLTDVKTALTPSGLLFIETGNLADLERREDFAHELGVPDHLVFAGEKHLTGYLKRAGFEVEQIKKRRVDGITALFKTVMKIALGRSTSLFIPYTSSYRQLLIRARLVN